MAHRYKSWCMCRLWTATVMKMYSPCTELHAAAYNFVTKIHNHIFMSHKSVPALLAILTFFSCSTEEEVNPLYGDGSSVPLVVAGRIYGYGESGSGTSSDDEHIGVYVAEYPSTGEIAYSNLGYTATYSSRDDYFSPDDIDNIPRFGRDDAKKWAVWAYCPYDADSEGRIVVTVSDQTKVSETTLLYARATGLDYSSNTAVLNLAPALTKLRFEFSKGNIDTDLSGISASLSGLPVIGNFDLATCHFGVSGSSASTSDINMTISENDGIAAEALVIPQSDTEGYVAKILVPGEAAARTFDISRYVGAFERGRQYDFEIIVNRSSLDITATSGSIADWEESDGTVEVGTENK